VFTKLVERVHYAWLLVCLGAGYAVIGLLRALSFLIPKPGDHDLAIYVHSPTGSDGHKRRFEVLIPFLDAEGIRYALKLHYADDEVKRILAGPRKGHYLLYARILWRRIFQVLDARRFKAVFIQRSLFPLYPDATTPHLEKLARKLCDNITLDFWDPVHLGQRELTFASFKLADKISVDNPTLFDCYAPLHPHPRLLPIAVDVSRYVRKTDYSLGRPARLLYTGSRGNVQMNLEPLLPTLADLATEVDIELVVIGAYAPRGTTFPVRHVAWDETTYYTLLAGADLGLFPYYGNPDQNRWRVAGKTLDYLASGLPFVGVTEGLPAGVRSGEHFIAVADPCDWAPRIREALAHQDLRESVGRRGRQLVEETFSLQHSYEEFKRIAFERV
jgi:glycosyltransferase involved in cell wall biosynthesis